VAAQLLHDLETARFGHELKQDSHGDLWFTAPRDTGCHKTGKPIHLLTGILTAE
jgi:hypothetical protein